VCVCVCVCVFVRGGRMRIECNRYYYETNRGFRARTKDDGMSFLENDPITEVKMYIYIIYYIHINCERSGAGVNSGASLFILRCDIKTTKRSIKQLMSAGPNSQSYSSKIALDAHIYTMLLRIFFR